MGDAADRDQVHHAFRSTIGANDGNTTFIYVEEAHELSAADADLVLDDYVVYVGFDPAARPSAEGPAKTAKTEAQAEAEMPK